VRWFFSPRYLLEFTNEPFCDLSAVLGYLIDVTETKERCREGRGFKLLNYFANLQLEIRSHSSPNFIIRIESTPKKKSSVVDNWYLDDFFEEFICGRWYIYLEQTIYHLCRPICCWLSSLAVEYHLLWRIISYVAWYSSKADDNHLTGTIFVYVYVLCFIDVNRIEIPTDHLHTFS
jgi:hypothetical protein